MNRLREYFDDNKANALHKWMHYFDIYDRYFSKYRNTEAVILEIGVFQGGSLKMWRDYFGPAATIYAIDINPNCRQFETEKTKIFIGSQDDRSFLKKVREKTPKVDILIDDGGHTMNQQIVSFEELYPHIKDDGIYLCEDLHTSYWKEFGGGHKKPGTFIEYSKSFIDSINAWHSRQKSFRVNDITRSAYALHYYDSILVVEKRKMESPEVRMTGDIIIPLEEFPAPREDEKSLIGFSRSRVRGFLKGKKS